MMQMQTSSHSRLSLTDNVETILIKVFQEHGIHISSRIGNEAYIYCLFHENFHSPAMSINMKTGLWQCFNPSCGKKGNLRQLYRHITGKSLGRELMIDPKELQKQIDKGFEVEKDDELVIDHIKIDYLTDEVSYLKYLVDRGYSLNTLKDFEVGYSKVKERVVIPVRDSSYKLIAFIGRAIEQDQVPKYLYTSGFKRKLALFNIQNAKQYDSVIVCEGSLDCLKIHQAGFSNCVSTLGAKVSEEQIKMLRRNFDTIMIFSDNDEAGEAMRSAIINGCQGKEMYVLDIPDGCKDPGEMTEEQIQESFLNKKQA